jgi:tetratricopeptide (TPR) repeat protein
MTPLVAGSPRPPLPRSTHGPRAAACLLSSLCLLSVVPALGQKPVPPQAPSVSSSTPLPAPVTIGGSAPVAGSFPTQIGASSLRATLLLKQVAADKTGQNSVEELLKAGVLKPEDLSWAVHHPRLWQPSGAAGAVSPGVIQVYDAYLARFGEQVAGAVSWEEPARSTFAQELSRRGDARCVPIFQAMTREWVEKWQAGDKAKIDGAVPGLHPLAWFYQAQGEMEKAAQAYERSAEYSVAPAWVGSALVEAARLYGEAGQKEKSEALYERAARQGSGWSKGVALYDRARALIQAGEQEDARALLQQEVSGEKSDQITVALLSLLGYSYYRTGDWAKAKEYSQSALDRQAKLNPLLPSENLEAQIGLARRTLEYSGQWQKSALKAVPEAVSLSVPSEPKAGDLVKAADPVKAGGMARASFGVQSLKRVPLQVTSDNPLVKVRAVSPERAADKGHCFEAKVMVEASPQALAEGFKANVLVKCAAYPGVTLTVPIHIGPPHIESQGVETRDAKATNAVARPANQ